MDGVGLFVNELSVGEENVTMGGLVSITNGNVAVCDLFPALSEMTAVS
jgi:hypothetical protein